MSKDLDVSTIVAYPNNDDLRLRYASLVRSDDLDFSRFVEIQVSRGKRRRMRSGESVSIAQEEKNLISEHSKRWASGVAEHCVFVEFDRGFVSFVGIDPHVFMAMGDDLLRKAPIRHVAFDMPKAGGAFPVAALAQCHFLGGLESIHLKALSLTDLDLAVLSTSPYLSECLLMDLSYNPLGFSGFHALAQSPSTRGMLRIYRNEGSRNNYHPEQRQYQVVVDDSWSPPVSEWAPLGEDGQALEREFGYLPWLHPQDNACDKFDARWFVDQGILPKRPAGSPVE